MSALQSLGQNEMRLLPRCACVLCMCVMRVVHVFECVCTCVAGFAALLCVCRWAHVDG